MQVLQIIHGTPQGYQQASQQLVTRAHLFGNQQIQIAAAKPPKQPPQILPKPATPQGVTTQQKQRVTTTITSQVTQQSQPQLVLTSPQQNQTTATMIPTAQGLLLNQVFNHIFFLVSHSFSIVTIIIINIDFVVFIVHSPIETCRFCTKF